MGSAEDLIYSVVAMMAAEGHIDERELKFLDMVRQHLGVDEDFVSQAVEEARAGKKRIRLPSSRKDRKRVLGVMVKAAAANGEIAPQERRLLAAIAHKTGVSVEDLTTLIDRAMAKHAPKGQAAEADLDHEDPGLPDEAYSVAVPSDEVTDGYRCMHCEQSFVADDALHNGVPVEKGTITKVFCPHCKKRILTSPSTSAGWSVIRLETVGSETPPGTEVFGKINTTLE